MRFLWKVYTTIIRVRKHNHAQWHVFVPSLMKAKRVSGSIIDIVENGNCHYRDRQFCDCSACPNRNVSNGGKLNYQPTTPSTTLLPRVASSESAAIGQMKLALFRFFYNKLKQRFYCDMHSETFSIR